jgi:hypothetical protein
MEYTEWPFVKILFRLSVGNEMETNSIITSTLLSGNHVEVDARCNGTNSIILLGVSLLEILALCVVTPDSVGRCIQTCHRYMLFLCSG